MNQRLYTFIAEGFRFVDCRSNRIGHDVPSIVRAEEPF